MQTSNIATKALRKSRTQMTPEQARAYLADPSNFWDNDELCYICGELWGASNEVEYNGLLFCANKCFRAYRDIEKIAESDKTAKSGAQQ
jgi:hypothetical protein